MGLFSFKSNKIKKMKVQLIDSITEVDNLVCSANLYKISSYLRKIIDKLDNPTLLINTTQFERINQEISIIKSYAKKGYEELLTNKCKNIISEIERTSFDDNPNKFENENNDRIYRIIGEQTEIVNQINVLSSKMESVLGKDKNLWLLYNMQRNTLYNRMAIIAKNYSTVLNAQSNLILSNEVRRAKEEAEQILSQSYCIDPEEFDDSANYINQANDEIADTTNRISESFAKNFGANNDDYAYEKVLEQQTLNGLSSSSNSFEYEKSSKK